MSNFTHKLWFTRHQPTNIALPSGAFSQWPGCMKSLIVIWHSSERLVNSTLVIMSVGWSVSPSFEPAYLQGLRACLYPNRNGWRKGPQYHGAGHWLSTAGQIQPVWSGNTNEGIHAQCYTNIPTKGNTYISQTQCKENIDRICVGRAYWAISTNDLQIFFFEGAHFFLAV